MWPLSSTASQTITQSHTMSVRATAFGPYGTQEIPVGGGVVTSDATSQVRRTASLVTPFELWPVSPRSILAPYGTEVLVEYGIGLPNGVIEWIPQIRGLLTETSRSLPVSPDGSLPISLVDRSARVEEDRLTAPSQTVAGATVVTEIRRLIQETLGGSVAVVDKTGSAQVAAQLDIERNRWSEGVEKLADSLGAEVFFDPQGNGVIRPQPQITDAAVWVVSSGESGILISQGSKLGREQVYNGVVASGQRTDGTAPVSYTAWDTDTASPTYYLGAFGKKPRFYVSSQLTTSGQAQTTATAMLARVRGMNASVTLTTVVNPALEAGDVILLRNHEDGTVQAHIVDKVTIPLSPSEAQSIETRSLDLPPEQ